MYFLKKYLSRFCGAAFLVLIFFTYSAAQGAPTVEQSAQVRAELKKNISSLMIAFDASCDEIAGILNQMIGNEIYKGSTKMKGLTADIMRNGPVSVSASDNYLYLTIPVTMSLRYGSFSTPPVSSKLKFKLNARITPDWKLNAEIYYMGISDLFRDEIGIGPLSIRPRTIIEGITDPIQRVISNLVSRKVNEKYSLRNEIAKAWNAAQKPVLLDKNSWLRIAPQEVMLYPVSAGRNRVNLSVGLKAFAEIIVGPQPPPPAPVPLPELKLVNSIDKTFHIALNTDLFYKDVRELASPLLLEKDFGSDGKSVILKDFDVYGNGDKLVIKIETRGSLEGVFYLTCKPTFNPQTNVFSVEDVDFDMNTRSFLLKAANWFLHSKIRNTIREKININLQERLEQARLSTEKAMDNVKLADHVFLKGSVKSIKLQDVIVRNDRVSIQVYTEGETNVLFK